uniref:hypothetical protein n=1 Tax=Prevotella sp. TaxID=59823 RepID=UPI004026DD26
MANIVDKVVGYLSQSIKTPKVLATLLAAVISASLWQTSAQLLEADDWADNVVTIRKAIGKRKRF